MLQKTIYHIIFFLCGLLVACPSSAQQGFYIPKAGKIFFSGDSATIFSNVLNEGRLGVGKKAMLNFKGQVWENDQQALITDETNGGAGVAGTGGIIRFLADSVRQKLVGGYNAATQSGPTFSNLQIQNNYGVELDGSSAKVLNELIFSSGLVHLNGSIFVVGNNNPGIISGYDSSRFFVTGTTVNGGMLLRENIKSSDRMVVFPVGTQTNTYTPAAVQSRSALGDHYYVSVFDGVRSNILNGNDLANESVNKIWQIGKMLRPGEDEVDIYLQHFIKDEGVQFALNRHHSYISQYTGTAWDGGFPRELPLSGSLTSGAPVQGGGLNRRTFNATLSDASYFTKFTGPGDSSVKTKLLLGAFRVNSSFVRVNWQTKPEVNVKHFVVERRFSNQSNFIAVDTTLATNTVNLTTLFYGIDDPNNYKGISFYRLKIVNRDNTSDYSNTVAVGGVGFYKVLLWPNPTPDKFYLIINSPSARSVVIYNNVGQKMWSTGVNANAQTYIEVKGHGLHPGTYFASILDERSVILQTEKLLIVDK